MSEVSRPLEKPWNCSVCTFENDGMMMVCEVCANPSGKSAYLHEPPGINRGGSTDDKIICEKCKKRNTLDSEKCVACGACLFGEAPPPKSKEDIILCRHCSFENHKDNKSCLGCQKNLSLIPEPRPVAEVSLKECPVCSCILEESLHARHVTECMQSLKMLERLEKQQKTESTDECPYCQIRFDKSISEKHIVECSKNGAFFKQDKVFGRMTKVQKETIQFMHTNSQKQHFSAKPQLETRFKKLGLKKEDLEALHHYIQNYAPIIVHIHITKHMEFFVKDTHYRNQFETGKSSGSLSRPSRISWESRMFCKRYDKATDTQRVKYGTINFTNDPKGVNSCRGYGNSYFLLKSEVRERCTLTDQDSSSANSLIGTFKFCYHVLNKLTDAELKAAVQAAKAMQVSSAVIGTYKEIQIHGPIEFAKDIQRLYVNKIEIQDKKFMKLVETFCKRFNVDYEIFS